MDISSSPHHFHLGPGFWAFNPEESRQLLLRRYVARAKELFAGDQERLPDNDRLQLIVQAAMEARALLFVAALNEPTAEDLDEFFDEFVIRSVFLISDFTESAHHEN